MCVHKCLCGCACFGGGGGGLLCAGINCNNYIDVTTAVTVG